MCRAVVPRYSAASSVVSQRNVAERAALAELREGNVARAVAWYARNGRVVVGRHRDAALDALAAGWRADVADGHQSAMYAWRRVDVAELNRRGREVWRSLGRLGEDELVAPGGTRYAVGDRVVTLAPGAGGKVVTSETGTVVALDTEAMALSVRMDDDGGVRVLHGEELAADRLAHSYALTVHRSQGSTVQRAHALEDAGGRELAYVKMSRAQDRSPVYVVADSLEQAAEDLRWEWSAERRPTWVIDSGTPAIDPAAVELNSRVAPPMRAALRRARLVAERNAIAAVIPPDRTPEIAAIERQLARLQDQRRDLLAGTGVYADQPVGQAARERDEAALNLDRVERNAAGARFGSKDRRRWAAEAGRWRDRHTSAAREGGCPDAPGAEAPGSSRTSAQRDGDRPPP